MDQSTHAALQIGRRTRELALFNLAIDSKLRSCDLVRLRVRDVCHGNVILTTTYFRAASTHRHICPLGNMRVSYVVGFGKLGWMPALMARTPYDGRRRR